MAVAQETLDRIARRNRRIGSLTRVLADRALADAARVDACISAGRDPGPLAGVPFAVKDLFDVAGETTTAGSAILASVPAATGDAAVVERLCAAGAVLVATANMDEFAYGFSTKNVHYGTTRNPHDPNRLAGGSSGGSAAAVAAGLVPLALGSDTNGSIRVPASLCGVYGLRPSFDSLPMDGVHPFVARLDTVGCFARTPGDLQTAHEVMLGRPFAKAPALPRAARLDGWFRANVDPAILAGVDAAAALLGGDAMVTARWAPAARSAAFVLTAAEGGHRHLGSLRRDPMALDPGTRDRLIAGALQPSAAPRDAEIVAARFIEEMEEILDRYDLLIAPSTLCRAPAIDAATVMIDGRPASARANLGLLAQPLSLAGVPCLSVPFATRPDELPFGVQLVAARGMEGVLLDAARRLVQAGLAAAPLPPAFPESE